MTLSEKDITQALNASARAHRRSLEDVRWHLDTFFESARATGGDAGVLASEIYTSSKISQRLKVPDSVYRKCKRDGIESIADIYEKIEDLIGLRIATPNKEQAESLFKYLHDRKDSWFCAVKTRPHFVKYTIPDKNTYSLETGYQAYHITFIHQRSYLPFAEITGWPVEIQIMSQLWEFWANFSRKYFYGQSGHAARLLPYNVVISRILDAAEDLMVATQNQLRAVSEEAPGLIEVPSSKEPVVRAVERPSAERVSTVPFKQDTAGQTGVAKPGKSGSEKVTTPRSSGLGARERATPITQTGETQVLAPEPTPAATQGFSAEDLRRWLTPRLATLFGTGTRMPSYFYLTKAAEDLALYDVTGERLESIFRDERVAHEYAEILRASNVSFLPPYQQILCRLLLSLGWDVTKVVERVNQEMWSIGTQLRVPHP